MSTRRTWYGAIAWLALSIACNKTSGGGEPAGSASTSAALPSVSAAAAPSASAAPTNQPRTFTGTYSLTPATLYLGEGKDYANVKQAKDDPAKHVGEGALTLEIDPNNRVTGTIESGPLSPAVIDGSVVEGEVRANVRRKDPKDDGLTGTLMAKLTGEAGEGTLALAESNAAIVREGKLSLKKK